MEVETPRQVGEVNGFRELLAEADPAGDVVDEEEVWEWKIAAIAESWAGTLAALPFCFLVWAAAGEHFFLSESFGDGGSRAGRRNCGTVAGFFRRKLSGSTGTVCERGSEVRMLILALPPDMGSFGRREAWSQIDALLELVLGGEGFVTTGVLSAPL